MRRLSLAVPFLSLALLSLFLLLVLPCSAECTAEQWKTDLELYQKYMGATPKDYLGAININRKWIQYAKDNPDQAKAANGGVSTDQMQANLNNVYRETAQVLVNDYSSLLKSDPVKAARLGIDVRKFFRGNPAVMREFANANNSTPVAMEIGLYKAIKQGFLQTFEGMASQYSQLVKDGKTAEAEKISSAWNTIISDLEAHGDKLPDQFKKFTGVDITKTVADVKAIEADIKAYNDAVAKGDFTAAFDLVKRWETYAKSDPGKMDAINFIFNATNGVKAGDKADWEKAFKDIKIDTYVAIFKADTKAYETAIAEGRLEDAKKLIEKWNAIVATDVGEGIAARFGYDLKTFKENLDKEMANLNGVDPANASESVASFKIDLAEYEKCVKVFQAAEPGSDAWYSNLARATELADKWSRIARENPTLAAQIKTATGIELPKASDAVIDKALDVAITDSAAKFNSYVATGQFGKARELVSAWKDFLNKHPRVKEMAIEKWGKGLMDTFDRYEKGLDLLAGKRDGDKTGDNTGDNTTTTTTPASSSEPTTGGPAVDTTGNDAGLGPSAD